MVIRDEYYGENKNKSGEGKWVVGRFGVRWVFFGLYKVVNIDFVEMLIFLWGFKEGWRSRLYGWLEKVF